MIDPTATAYEAAPCVPPVGPPVGLASGPLGAVQMADREIARQTAARARAVAQFAVSRPASADRQQGQSGAMSPERWAARPDVLRPVSEWAAQELSVALSITRGAAETLLERDLSLVQRLPGVLSALEAGALHVGHLWPLLDLVAPIADDRQRAELEADLLRWLAERSGRREVTTPAQLRDKARREALKRGARTAAESFARALQERGVFLRGEPTVGMAAVTALLTLPEAQALHAALGAYVDALPHDPGDPRSRGQKMADCLLDLVLRPGESQRPPVQITLTVVAAVGTMLGGDAPGEVNGQVVPAEMVRSLLRLLTGTPTADPDTDPGHADPEADRDTAGVDTAAFGADTAAAQSIAGAEPAAGCGEDTTCGAAAEPTPAGDAEAPAGRRSGWLDWAGNHDPAGDPTLTPAQRQALWKAEARWWAEFERRLFAGELLGADLDPFPGEPTRSGLPIPDHPAPDHTAPDHPAPDHPAPDDPAPPSDGGGGWWAAADCAVDDASQAMYRAQAALGHARRLVRTAERADAADEAGWQAAPAGRVNAATDALEALAAAADTDRQTLADLLARTAGGGLADRPRIALVDALTGALISLTDLPELRRTAHCGHPACRRAPQTCDHDLTDRPALGAPGPTDGYRPATALDRFLRARDRRCRFAGCRRPVAKGELDHRIRYPDGPTAAANIAGFCVGHHRGKHQAPGWTYDLTPDATLTVTTPTGLTATTTPPPYSYGG